MEITVKGNKITLKKDYLTNGEVNYIVGELLKIYNDSGDIEGYDYNPLTMITNFYALLFGFCIEGYDIDSDEDYNKYYNIGAHYELLRVVTNADEAYHLMISLSKQISPFKNFISLYPSILGKSSAKFDNLNHLLHTLQVLYVGPCLWYFSE